MINIPHIFEMVETEIGGAKQGADRFYYSRNPNVMLDLLNTCLVELADDTRAFITNSVNTLDEANTTGNNSFDERTTSNGINKKEYGWEDTQPVSGQWDNQALDWNLWSFIYYPANYLALKLMVIGGVDAQEYSSQADPGVPVYVTRPEGWFIARESSEIDKVDKLEAGDQVYAEYYYYPQAKSKEQTIKANPMCNTALFHLMMHYVMGKDPFIEIPEDHIENMMFGTARWHKAKYDRMALKIRGIADGQHHKSEGTIKPYYL